MGLTSSSAQCQSVCKNEHECCFGPAGVGLDLSVKGFPAPRPVVAAEAGDEELPSEEHLYSLLDKSATPESIMVMDFLSEEIRSSFATWRERRRLAELDICDDAKFLEMRLKCQKLKSTGTTPATKKNQYGQKFQQEKRTDDGQRHRNNADGATRDRQNFTPQHTRP